MSTTLLLHADPLAAEPKKNGTKESGREVPSGGYGDVCLGPSIDKDTAPLEKGEVVPTLSSRLTKDACYPLKVLRTKWPLLDSWGLGFWTASCHF